jgi:predicted lipid-binding transport protein (Tim44 family)
MTSSHNPLPDVGVSLRPPPDVADLIRVINARNEAVEDPCLRACRATDIAARSALAAQQSAAAAKDAELASRAIQAGYRRRRAWWLRLLVALAALALDGMACYFAVQALGGSQSDILLWTCLFLGALSAGQVILDFCRKRAERAWRALATLGTRGKCLGSAFSSRAVTAASSASRPASPRAPPTATAVIVTALAAATRVIAIWTPPLRWPQMHPQEG